jgi:hypothetical protein
MTRIALIAGTYAPDRCGMAHYTDRLRTALSDQTIEPIVLTTIVAANEPTVRGVVNDWHLRDLLALVRAVHRSDIEIFTHSTRGGDLWLRSGDFPTPSAVENDGMATPDRDHHSRIWLVGMAS